MKLRTLNRRTLLRGAGGVALALPMLEAMVPRRAHAASPKRLVIFFTPNGTNDRSLAIPSQTGTDFKLPLETAPLSSMQKDLLVLSGLNMRSAMENRDGDLHSIGMSHMLTCVKAVRADSYPRPGGDGYHVSFGGGPSIDQTIAQTLKPPTRLQTLELGVQSILGIGVHPFSRMIYEDKLRPKPAQDDPREVFKALTSNLTPTVPNAPDGSTVDHSREQRGSVLDYVMDDYKRLSTKLSGLDKRKVEGHLQGLRQIELQLNAMTKEGSAPVAAPRLYCGMAEDPSSKVIADAFQDQSQFPVLGKLQMDLLAMALACDVTRIASIQWSWARSTHVFSWLGQRDRHHDITHRSWTEGLGNINRWYAEQLAYLGSKLKEIKEEPGSILDNTVIYWCSEVATGGHLFNDTRTFLLGSCGGFFKTGQHIRFNGEPHNKLMVTLMRAMGIADANQFGDPKYAAGPLPGLG